MTHAAAAVAKARPLLILVAGLWLAPVSARAQANVGAGPLTQSLPDSEPAAAVLRIGPVRFAPGIQVQEAGYDDNVFYEAVDPKEDWMVSATPDVQVFARLRLLRLAAYAGVNLTYYDQYTSERSVSEQYRGRVDLIFSTIRPFVGGGHVAERTRPNGEISVRADRLDTEVSGGLAFDFSPTSRAWGSAQRVTTEYQSTEEFEGVPLDEALNRDGDVYEGGLQTALTPLTTLTVSGSYGQDRFRASPERDSDNREVEAQFGFSQLAVIRGTARVGFRDFRPNDPAVFPYTGMVVGASLTVPIVDIGRLHLLLVRDIQYSFDEVEAYYLEHTAELTYTHLIFGQFDVQARGGWSGFDYGHREGLDDRRDTLTTWAAGVGYNLQNRTRIAVQYEQARRRSAELAERNYDRRRIYLSWTLTL